MSTAREGPRRAHVGKLALFVSFFPQVIQGPIGVYDQLAHQLYDEHKYNLTTSATARS